MNTNYENDGHSEPAQPSAEFIQAISRFFDTDPSDLLLEMGYYDREETIRSHENMTTAQE